jgi:hypothetical protein
VVLTGCAGETAGNPWQDWDLYAALEPADVAELCNAIRDLRDADHEDALHEGADRERQAAEVTVTVPEPELAEVSA